jgi:hypothetical protein
VDRVGFFVDGGRDGIGGGKKKAETRKDREVMKVAV